MDLAQDWYNPRICKGWQEDGWYCGTMGTTPDIHYGGFDWDCIQCGRGWVERGWFCGCCWQHEGQRVEQEQTRKKFNLAPIPKEHTQQRKPEFEEKNSHPPSAALSSMGFDFSSTSLSSKKSANAIENKYPIGIPTEWDGKLSNFKSPTTAEVLLSITSRRSGIVYGQLTWQASGIRCPVTITQHEESLSILCQISTTEQVTIDATISNKGWAITGSAKSLPSSKLTLNQR